MIMRTETHPVLGTFLAATNADKITEPDLYVKEIVLLDADRCKEWQDGDLCAMLGMERRYAGPGMPFSHRPVVERGPFHVLIRQTHGIDI